jgi:hypothetical protein
VVSVKRIVKTLRFDNQITFVSKNGFQSVEFGMYHQDLDRAALVELQPGFVELRFDLVELHFGLVELNSQLLTL